MCVVAIAWDAHPRWLLVAIGNRDEYHERPAATLAPWPKEAGFGSGIIAGRDLRAGGTWLGVSEQGRFALVTNYRAPGYPQPGRPSRGALVTDLLTGRQPEAIAEMNPFNLVLADRDGLRFLTNYPEEVAMPLPPGIHGLSNGGFESPWPKTHQLNGALESWLSGDAADFTPLFTALRAETPEADCALPEDGPEPCYAPVFIRDPVYGTRCSTVVAIDREGNGTIVERRFDAQGEATGETSLPFRWP